MFDWLRSFLSRLFRLARPGLEQFLRDALPEIKAAVRNYALAHLDEKFHDWKDKIRVLVRARFPNAPHTWVEIALNFAHEHVKRELEGERPAG